MTSVSHSFCKVLENRTHHSVSSMKSGTALWLRWIYNGTSGLLKDRHGECLEARLGATRAGYISPRSRVMIRTSVKINPTPKVDYCFYVLCFSEKHASRSLPMSPIALYHPHISRVDIVRLCPHFPDSWPSAAQRGCECTVLGDS